MRGRVSIVLVCLAGAVLSGCGQKSAGSDQAEVPTEPASAPAEPSPEQIKADLAKLPAPYDAADPVHGKRVFGQCASCHTAVSGGPNMTGPNLYGIFGRKAGSAAGFSYSDALKAANFTWDAPRLNAWLTNPRAVAAGTKMSFMGLPDAKDRADVIAYLSVQTRP